MDLQEYIVEVNGTFFIPERYKYVVNGLDLERDKYRVNEILDIDIRYMSFIIWGKDEYSAVEKHLVKNIKKEILNNSKIRNNPAMQHFRYIIKEKLHDADLKLNYCYLRPTGRTSSVDGPIPFVDYDLVKPRGYFKGQITRFVSRMLVSEDLTDLDNKYNWFLERIDIEEGKKTGFKRRLLPVIENIYNEQRQKIIDGKIKRYLENKQG